MSNEISLKDYFGERFDGVDNEFKEIKMSLRDLQDSSSTIKDQFIQQSNNIEILKNEGIRRDSRMDRLENMVKPIVRAWDILSANWIIFSAIIGTLGLPVFIISLQWIIEIVNAADVLPK